MQPPTDCGVSSIITPLSLWDLGLNEACFLPGAISFHPGWRLKADQWRQYLWCHFDLQQRPLPLFQLVWNTHKDQFFPKMVKKCLGSILLPEKHSLLYLSMFLRQGTVYTEQKQKKWGREKFQILVYAGDLLAESQHKQGPNQTLAADLWKSHAESLLAEGHRGDSSSPLPLRLKRQSRSWTMNAFYKTSPKWANSYRLLPENTPNIHPQVPPPSTGLRANSCHSHSFLISIKGTDYRMQTELENLSPFRHCSEPK